MIRGGVMYGYHLNSYLFLIDKLDGLDKNLEVFKLAKNEYLKSNEHPLNYSYMSKLVFLMTLFDTFKSNFFTDKEIKEKYIFDIGKLCIPDVKVVFELSDMALGRIQN